MKFEEEPQGIDEDEELNELEELGESIGELFES